MKNRDSRGRWRPSTPMDRLFARCDRAQREADAALRAAERRERGWQSGCHNAKLTALAAIAELHALLDALEEADTLEVVDWESMRK